MSKGLEALNKLIINWGLQLNPQWEKDIEKELKELEERREMMRRFNKACVPMILDNQTEKKLKALKIIKEKKVDVFQLVIAIKVNDLNEYNKRHAEWCKLTQEEFDLLKDVML